MAVSEMTESEKRDICARYSALACEGCPLIVRKKNGWCYCPMDLCMAPSENLSGG